LTLIKKLIALIKAKIKAKAEFGKRKAGKAKAILTGLTKKGRTDFSPCEQAEACSPNVNYAVSGVLT